MNISKQRISKILFSRCLGGFANGFKTSLMKKLLILSLTTLSFFVFNNVYAAVNFHARVSPSWQELFGLGYNPNHFYNKTVPSPTGDNYDAFNDNDSLAVPIDLPAMQKAGFNSVRIYGGSPLTVIRTIQTSGKLGMGVVWTIGMPPSSDPTKPSVYPPNSSTPNYRDFLQVLDYAKSNPSFRDQFQNTVKVIVVWNEKIFNKGMNGNLCAWIRAVGDTLHDLYGFSNIPVTTAAPTSVWLVKPGSPTGDRSDVLQAIADANQNIADTEIPILCHMYPFQWGNIYYKKVPDPSDPTKNDGLPDIDNTKPKSSYGIPAIKPHFDSATGGPNWSVNDTVNNVRLNNSIAWDIKKLNNNFKAYTISAVHMPVGKSFKIVIGETGWATSGYDKQYASYGYAVENIANLNLATGNPQQAAEYAQAVYKYCKTNSVPVMYFMAMDVPWKNGTESIVSDNAEANYGIFDTWGKMKPSVTDPAGYTFNFYPSWGTLANVAINYKDYTVMPYNPGAPIIPYTSKVKYTQGGSNLIKTFSKDIDTSSGKTFFGMNVLFITKNDTVQIFDDSNNALSPKHKLLSTVGLDPGTAPDQQPEHVGGTWDNPGMQPNYINWSNGKPKAPGVPGQYSGIFLPATKPAPFFIGHNN